jgi:hypothetical protein
MVFSPLSSPVMNKKREEVTRFFGLKNSRDEVLLS